MSDGMAPHSCDYTHVPEIPCRKCGGTSGLATQPVKPLRFKLSPELVDGHSWAVVDDKAGVLEAVGRWCEEFASFAGGEHFTVETVEMTQEEVDALPEI